MRIGAAVIGGGRRSFWNALESKKPGKSRLSGFFSVSKKSERYGVIPNQWCSAQRIKIVMIASGNHTVIYRRLVWESPG